MSKYKKESFFWTSYSDMMTSLFFVMLVLFVLALVIVRNNNSENITKIEELTNKEKSLEHVRDSLADVNDSLAQELKNRNSRISELEKECSNWKNSANATKEELEKLNMLYKSIENINPNYFQYDPEFKRHTLKNISIKFKPRSSNINDISKNDKDKLLDAGKEIVLFMIKAKYAIRGAEYMLIIEGQSSQDGYAENFELSYKRALSLVRLWKDHGISFDQLPCELIISGSGTESRFRKSPERIWDSSHKRYIGNPENQRFVIHIIPKPGNIQ